MPATIQGNENQDYGPYSHIKKGSMGDVHQMSVGAPRGRAGSNSTGSNSNNSRQKLAVPILPRNGQAPGNRSSALSANSAYSDYPSNSSHEKSVMKNVGGQAGGAGMVWDSKDPEMDDYLVSSKGAQSCMCFVKARKLCMGGFGRESVFGWEADIPRTG